MKGVGRYVILNRIKETERKVNGIELPEDKDKDLRYYLGEVLAFGDLVKGLNIGDKVRYDRAAAHGADDAEGNLVQVLKDDGIAFVI